MSSAGPDHYAHAHMHVDELVVKLKLRPRFAFEEVIRFCQLLVVMYLGVGRYVGYVDCTRIVLNVRKGPPRRPTGTDHTRYVSEVNDLEATLDSIVDHLMD